MNKVSPFFALYYFVDHHRDALNVTYSDHPRYEQLTLHVDRDLLHLFHFKNSNYTATLIHRSRPERVSLLCAENYIAKFKDMVIANGGVL